MQGWLEPLLITIIVLIALRPAVCWYFKLTEISNALRALAPKADAPAGKPNDPVI